MLSCLTHGRAASEPASPAKQMCSRKEKLTPPSKLHSGLGFLACPCARLPGSRVTYLTKHLLRLSLGSCIASHRSNITVEKNTEKIWFWIQNCLCWLANFLKYVLSPEEGARTWPNRNTGPSSLQNEETSVYCDKNVILPERDMLYVLWKLTSSIIYPSTNCSKDPPTAGAKTGFTWKESVREFTQKD